MGEKLLRQKKRVQFLSLSHREQTGQFKLHSIQSEVSGEPREQQIHYTQKVEAGVRGCEVCLDLVCVCLVCVSQTNWNGNYKPIRYL